MHEYAWLKRTKGQYRVIHLSVKIRRKQKMVKKLKQKKKSTRGVCNIELVNVNVNGVSTQKKKIKKKK